MPAQQTKVKPSRARGSPHGAVVLGQGHTHTGHTDKKFDHTTGKGWVAARKGDYDDALRVKKNGLSPFFFESTGAASPHTFHTIKQLAEKNKGDVRRRDGTSYSRNRRATKSFLSHHLQSISMAIVLNDAKTINNNIAGAKRRALRAAPPLPTLWDSSFSAVLSF